MKSLFIAIPSIPGKIGSEKIAHRIYTDGTITIYRKAKVLIKDKKNPSKKHKFAWVPISTIITP